VKLFSDDRNWSFEAVEGDPYGHPFPTNENIRGTNPGPWVVAVCNGEEPYATVYVRSGDRETCEQVAHSLSLVCIGDWRDELATMWWSKGLFLGAP